MASHAYHKMTPLKAMKAKEMAMPHIKMPLMPIKAKETVKSIKKYKKKRKFIV